MRKKQTSMTAMGIAIVRGIEAVDGTLSFIANHSGAGSSVIFDYMYFTLLDGTIEHGEVTNMRNRQWLSSEAMAFGIPEGKVVEFLEGRGFT